MADNSFHRQRLGGAWFFMAPALMYGIFTSRLPAIKAAAALDDTQVGMLLLFLGLSTLAGLVTSGFAIERWGAVKTSTLAVFWFSAAMTAGAYFNNYAALLLCCALTGIGVGFCDVGMNAIGIEIEKRHKDTAFLFCMAAHASAAWPAPWAVRCLRGWAFPLS